MDFLHSIISSVGSFFLAISFPQSIWIFSMAMILFYLWRGADSNCRSQGYEPSEVPLLYPAKCAAQPSRALPCISYRYSKPVAGRTAAKVWLLLVWCRRWSVLCASPIISTLVEARSLPEAQLPFLQGRDLEPTLPVLHLHHSCAQQPCCGHQPRS